MNLIENILIMQREYFDRIYIIGNLRKNKGYTNMKNFYLYFLLVFSLLILQGCFMYGSSYSPPVKQDAVILLKENDFDYIARNLTGEYSCDYILGIPLDDPRLFSNALADLYTKVQPLAEGKSTQLINWTYDRYTKKSCIFLLPSTTTAKFRADLIEFKK